MSAELRDFLSWFDGFAENIKSAPNKEQWLRIKKRIQEIPRPAVMALPGGAPKLVASAPAAVPANVPFDSFAEPTEGKPRLSKGAASSAGP